MFKWATKLADSNHDLEIKLQDESLISSPLPWFEFVGGIYFRAETLFYNPQSNRERRGQSFVAKRLEIHSGLNDHCFGFRVKYRR